MLSAPDATPETLKQFADINGLSFDPRDVEAFFAAKARGENSNVPIPIIDPGDGRTGATARGFGDPIGFPDAMGGAVDAVGGPDHRVRSCNRSKTRRAGTECVRHCRNSWAPHQYKNK